MKVYTRYSEVTDYIVITRRHIGDILRMNKDRYNAEI